MMLFGVPVRHQSQMLAIQDCIFDAPIKSPHCDKTNVLVAVGKSNASSCETRPAAVTSSPQGPHTFQWCSFANRQQLFGN